MAPTASSPVRVIGFTAAERRAAESSPIPGDGLLHPLALLAIGILIVNDHALKAAWPGVVTGKLSDVAGLLFFPLFLQGVWEVGLWALRRPAKPSRGVLISVISFTGVAFAAIKLIPAATDAAESLLGTVQLGIGQLLSATSQAGPLAVQITADPSDLVALPMLALAYAIGIRRCRVRTQ